MSTNNTSNKFVDLVTCIIYHYVDTKEIIFDLSFEYNS